MVEEPVVEHCVMILTAIKWWWWWLNEMRGTWKKWNNYVGKLARQKDKFILLALQFEYIQEHVINLICDCVCFHFFFQELRSLDWNCILRCNFHFQKVRSIKPVPTLPILEQNLWKNKNNGSYDVFVQKKWSNYNLIYNSFYL